MGRYRFTVAGLIALPLMASILMGLSASQAAAASPKSTWVIGNVGSYTGVYSSTTDGGKFGIEAWADWVNAHGGVDGHHIDLIVKDDTTVPATALSDVEQLVQQDHIIALVGETSTATQAIEAYLHQQGIPVIGGLPSTVAGFGVDADWYPASTQNSALLQADVLIAKAAGANHVADFACAESPTCAAGAQGLSAFAKKRGLPFYYSIVSSTLPNYDAPCLAAKAAGANAIVVESGANVQIQLAKSCVAEGWKPLEVAYGSNVISSELSVPDLNGLLSSEPDLPFSDTTNPQMKTFQAALKKYAPQAALGGEFSGESSVLAWASGELFAAAATSGKLGNHPTAKQVENAMYTLPKNFTDGGLNPPLTFVKNEPTVVSCYFTLGIKNGKFTTPDGQKFSCPSKV
jgi:branched-chain amino acid transport system substrate-binding protein